MLNFRKLPDSAVPGEHNDCTVSAVAKACRISYGDAWTYACIAGRRHGKSFWSNRILDTMVERKLITYSTGLFKPAKRPTLAQLLPRLNTGRYILETTSHALSVVNGCIYDHELKLRYRIHHIFVIEVL